MKVSMLIPWRPDEPRTRLFEWAVKHWAYLKDSLDLEVVLGGDDGEPFNRGRARNNAYAKSTGDILLVVDADTVVNISQALEAVHLVATSHDWVIAYDIYWNLDPASTELMLEQPPGSTIVEPATFDHRLGDSVSGVLAIPRAAWVAVGGYDERFGKKGWGWEDRAFADALDTLWKPHRRVAGPAFHLWHPAPHESTFGSSTAQERAKLAARYRRASGHHPAMRRIVDEHLAAR